MISSSHPVLALVLSYYSFFFFNDTAPTEIYTLSLHDALPIFGARRRFVRCALILFGIAEIGCKIVGRNELACPGDRKSTRLNSSHQIISYAVFCLKKKKDTNMLEPVPYNKAQTRNKLMQKCTS